MPDLLIAVGGTGQHVALAVSRLVFLGALPKMELAVVDADDSSKFSSDLRTFGETVRAGYTEHPLINGDKIYPPFDKAAKLDPQFHELFLTPYANLLEREIFELCFEEGSATISVKDGMFGRPSVGATIFAHNKESQLGPVFERARQASQIFVAGSLVGGTGAGIIHQLVKTLHSEEKGKRIYGLIFLRWFQVPSGKEKQTISDDSLDRNMRYGLDYFFKDTRPLLAFSLLIGQPEHPTADEIRPISLEAGKTEEKKHYFHLMAAYGILRLPAIAVTEQPDGSIYASAFESVAQMYEEKWDQGKPLHWYVNRGAFVKEILDYVGSRKFKEEILQSFKLFGKPDNVGRGLHETIARYDKSQRKTVVEEITKTWSLLSKQYEFSLTWLAEVLKPLPDSFYLDKYRRVRENDDAKVKEIQTVWAKAPLLGEHLFTSPETSPEVARKFHEMLVESFA